MSYSLSLDVQQAAASQASSEKTFTLQATPRIKLNTKALYVSAVRGEQGRGQRFRVTNVGSSSIKLDSSSFSFSGTDASQFAIVSGTLPRTLKAGRGASFTVAMRASSTAPVDRVLTAKLLVRAAGSSTTIGTIDVRGIATTGEGGDKEPSLARLMQLYKFGIDVGDSSPNTTFLDIPNGADTDEIFAPRFQKVGSGPVQIEMLASYLSDSDTVAGRVGYYDPGTPEARKELFSIYGVDAQTVKPTPNGASRFDPGSKPFSLWAEAPIFLDSNGEPRIVYGEDALNTWEPDSDSRRKVRVYPLVEDGKTVSNAYVVTFEEYEVQNDQNDVVFVLRNVSVLGSRPEVGLIAAAEQPDPTRLVMSRIQTNGTTFHSEYHDEATVRIVNTGNQDLAISSIALSGTNAGDFQIISGGGSGTLARNATRDVTIRFTADSGPTVQTATLTINSNDSDEAKTNVSLNGLWQPFAEVDGNGNSVEPKLQQILDALGYRVTVVKSGQLLDNDGKTEAVGDEVLAGYWRAADANVPVVVEQIGGWHSTDTNNAVAWYERGKPYFNPLDPRYNAATQGPENVLFRQSTADTQTLFPHIANSDTAFARGSFKTDKAFGFRIDGEFSDDSLNVQQAGDKGGHHVRFYPVRDARGEFVPNSYLMVLDFSSINFDYNDHVLLIHNIRPIDRNAAVESIGGYGTSGGGITLDWNDVPEARGYSIYRSDKAGGTYTRIATDVLVSQYVDSKASKDKTWYYRVLAENANGKESLPIGISVRRPA